MKCITLLIVLFMATIQNDSCGQFAGVREVIVFGTDTSIIEQQLSSLHADKAGLSERDIKITRAEVGDDEYEKYKVKADEPFVVILVGKDTGEKFRSSKPVTNEKLFSLIDAMPMRRAEMRQQKNQDQ